MDTSFETVLELFQFAVAKYPSRTAFTCMGTSVSYAEVDRLTLQFARYLQNHTDLKVGDRIAIQLPNIPQFPIVFFGAIRAGLTIVNINPLYTSREVKHQLCDSGAKALVVLANVADSAAAIIHETQVEKVVVTELADFMPQPKRFLVNTVVRYIKKMVPAFKFPHQESYLNALHRGLLGEYIKPKLSPDDILVLQYTGGTTGFAKGAVLSHKNLCANAYQIKQHLPECFGFEPEVFAAPLPFYHIYAFNLHLFCAFSAGSESLLIPNPRDIPAFVKTLSKTPATIFVGLNTLFIALCRNEAFRNLDFSRLKITSSGGMALTVDAAQKWEKITGTQVCEGYGLTETSPVVCSNQPNNIVLGTIGKPLPDTQVKVVDHNGVSLASGKEGELCVKGPQVMRGYWQQPEETEKAFLEQGWFLTGDIATIDDQGYIKLVDRKKDMIIVSGFNVYPNEIENIVVGHPDIIEAAAIGIDDKNSGQVVKLFVVRSDDSLTEEAIIAFCKKSLTGYKIPKLIEFRDELPKTNVGKILRRKLRDIDV